MVHIGHIHHFIEAKNMEIASISITGDKFVKKGFNKPYFDERKDHYF